MKHAAGEAIAVGILADEMQELHIGSGVFDKALAEAGSETGVARRQTRS